MNNSATVKRWASIGFIALVAWAAWTVREPADMYLAGLLYDAFGRVPILLAVPATVVLVVALCWPFAKGRWFAFLGFKRFIAYPPIWVSVVLASILIGLTTFLTREHLSEPALKTWIVIWYTFPLLMLLIVLLSFVMLGLWFDQRVEANSKPDLGVAKTKPRLPGNYNELVKWLKNDKEVENPDRDCFGHDEIARRIVKRLCVSEPPTMAVVGPLGSGKSTIGAFVEHHLQEKSSIVFVRLSLWPYSTAEGAVAGILGKLISAIGQRVPVLAVKGLGSDYIAVIEGLAGRWGVLARLMRGPTSPQLVLERLDTIAAAAGLRLVLWIEDLERFTGQDRRPSSRQAEQGKRADDGLERLRPITALLHLLDRQTHISVVLADASLKPRVDVEKIARFVERTPRLTAEHVWEQITILRAECLSQDFIDPATEEMRKELTQPEEARKRAIWLDDSREGPRIPAEIPLLLTAPRTLKTALRWTHETWEQLKGEIDFDSVLVASILRASRPDVFALMDEHIEAFRIGIESKRPGGKNSGKFKKAYTASDCLQTLFKDEPDKRHENAIRKLISFIFPMALSDEPSEDRSYIIRPQGLTVNRHVDYWRHYMSLPDIPEHERDQSALRAIEAWKCGEAANLLKMLQTPGKGEQIETFVGMFKPEELCCLLKDIVTANINQSAKTWGSGMDAPGLLSVWEMMHAINPPADMLANTLVDLFPDLIPQNLPLAQGLYCYFALDEQSSGTSLLEDENRVKINIALREGLQALGKAGGSRLLMALREQSPHRSISFPHLSISFLVSWAWEQGSEIPFDGWDVFAKAILDAAATSPQVVLPQIVSLVSREVPENPTELEFDENRARVLFDLDNLARLFAESSTPETPSEQLRSGYEAAQEWAIKFLKGNQSSDGS